MRQKSWNQFKKTMAASTLAGAITFTGCAVMPSVTAFADTTEQTGQVSYDNEGDADPHGREDGGKTVDEGYVMYGFGWKEPVLCV